MFTNNCQIEQQLEKGIVVNPTKYLVVYPSFDNIFQNNITNNKRNCCSFKFKIHGVNKMKDNFGNECYGCIYKVINLVNKKIYIGQTTNFEKRKHTHLKHAKRGAHSYFHNALGTYGIHNFKWKILGYCYSKEELSEAEKECIWLYKSFGLNDKNFDNIYGYNKTKGGLGGSRIGCKNTIEHNQILSKISKNRKMSDEMKAYLSKLNSYTYIERFGEEKANEIIIKKRHPQKIKRNKEQCEAISLRQIGIKKSEEQVEKSAESHRKLKHYYQYYILWLLNNNIDKKDIAKELKIGYMTLYRFIKKYNLK